MQSWYRIFKALTAYIKEHYPSGITWNKDGLEPEEALRLVQSGQISSSRSPPPASSAPAPPPPPPPLPKFDSPPPLPPPMPSNGTSTTRNGTTDMGAVFSELSKGEAVTAGLRKVDPSQQTHKNPSLRAGSQVPPVRSNSQSSLSGKSGSVPGKKPKPETLRTKKPPRKELDGNKWIIENFESPAEGVIEIDAQISHSILITKCKKVTIRVLNKANAISIDSSSHVSLIIDSLVSAVDVIKTPKFEMQVLGTLPTIMLDQVDGAMIYLGRKSLGTEVFTSKCAAVNVSVLGLKGEEDYVECPLPEQIKSYVKNGQLVSEIVEHAG
jgi:adenylyl cyclase-associated protein